MHMMDWRVLHDYRPPSLRLLSLLKLAGWLPPASSSMLVCISDADDGDGELVGSTGSLPGPDAASYRNP